MGALALAFAARAELPFAEGAPPDAPVLSGSSATLSVEAQAQLLTFKGTTLLNEFVYRALLQLPGDAAANPQTAREVAEQLATFLREAGYELAKVRAEVKGAQIEVTIDEGTLDKVIVSGAGWIAALRFRAALNLPLDVFNRSLFEQQLPRLAKQFGWRSYRYELWPVHLLDVDNGAPLDSIEELRAMPLLHPARGYELRIFATPEPWSPGFSPEVILNGAIGIGAGGRYRWRDLLQDGDRWQVHFRAGAALRGSLDPNGSTQLINSEDYLSARWLSRPWGGSSSGLRMTIAPRMEFWELQRPDLQLQSYRIATLEAGAGAGAQLTQSFSLYFTLGVQRRWVFDVVHALAYVPIADVTNMPEVSNRGFLRATSVYVFNPSELRVDMRDVVSLDVDAFQPTGSQTRGYLKIDAQGRKLFAFGWHELRLGGRIEGEIGEVNYVDEIPISDQLRLGFGLAKYTLRMGTVSAEFRYSLLRDKVKVGVFADTGAFRHLGRDDPREASEVAGAVGGGLFFFVFDELQIDMFYGVGWATDHYLESGFALAIKEAF